MAEWLLSPRPLTGIFQLGYNGFKICTSLINVYNSLIPIRIGFSMAQRLAVDGAHVVVSSRNQDNVDQAVDKLKSEGLSVSGMVCHAGLKEDRQRLIEKTAKEFGGFDILISNAAVNPDSGRIMKVGYCPSLASFQLLLFQAYDILLSIALKSIVHRRGMG